MKACIWIGSLLAAIVLSSTGWAVEPVAVASLQPMVTPNALSFTGRAFRRCPGNFINPKQCDIAVTITPKTGAACTYSTENFIVVSHSHTTKVVWTIVTPGYQFKDGTNAIEFEASDDTGGFASPANSSRTTFEVTPTTNRDAAARYVMHIVNSFSGAECDKGDPVVVNEN